MHAKISSVLLAATLAVLVSSPSYADIRNVLTFRDVEIPWTLQHEDVVIEKGTYDVHLIKHGIQAFCLKIRQNGQTICLIKDPAQIEYAEHNSLYEIMRDKDIPKEAKLCIKRIPALNAAYFLVETGNTKDCKFQKIRFKVNCLEI